MPQRVERRLRRSGATTQTKATGGEGQPAVMSFAEYNSYLPTAWTQVNNVPEPTSGLLLLLGVAGLALRRGRRA